MDREASIELVQRSRVAPQFLWLAAVLILSATACKIALPHGDLTPPVVQSVVPADSAVDVSVHDSISVTFSEAMNTDSAEAGFSLSDGTSEVQGTFSWSSATMSFDPSVCLTHGVTYQVKLTTASRDLSANHLEQEFITHFTTSAADPAAPGLTKINPANLTVDVPVDTAITITFSECMDREAAQGAFSLSDGVAQVEGTFSWLDDTMSFQPECELSVLTVYQVKVSTAVKDASGQAIAEEFSSSFTTNAAAPAPPRVTAVSPADLAAGVPLNSTISVTFSEYMDTSSAQSAFSLSNGISNVLGTFSWSGTTMIFDPSTDLSGSTVYQVKVAASARDTAGNNMSGEFHSSFHTVPDAPPRVTGISPADLSTDVPLGASVSVAFSESMNATSAQSAFSLSSGASNVPGTFSWSGTTMIFNPINDLSFSTDYCVTLMSSAKDTAGNSMSGEFSSSFRTIADTTAPSITSVSPAHLAVGVLRNTKVAIAFSEPMDTASVQSAFSLSDDISPVAGTFNWSGNTLTFAPSSLLSRITLYTEKVSSSAQDLAGNAMTADFELSFTTVAAIKGLGALYYHTVAVLSDGMVKSWGYNIFSQLGDGTSYNRNTPVTVNEITNVVAVAAGGCHTVALLSDGTLKAWGDARTTPIKVGGITNAVAVSAGYEHTVALLSDGTVKSWGRNDFGQLGDGTTTYRTTPVTVSGITNAVAVATGGFHNLALLADGTVVSWGYNNFGQLGDGTNTNRTTPVAVSGIANAVAVAAGYWHAVVLLGDGTAKSWGYNYDGQVGDGTTNGRYTPVTVSGITTAVAIAAGGEHTIALLSDGMVKSWGSNEYGQLGDGTTTTRKTPVTVSGITNAVVLAAGYSHTVALLSDGTVKSWGRNNYGQLGDGTNTTRSTPVTVSGL